MNKIANRQVMCEVLMKEAENESDLVVLTSDSRGSASLGAFAEKFPERLVETGIAEQNIVGIAAGLAHSGKRPFVASPACFLSMRSIEQVKVDVAYSGMNVKLIGISGGVSYGALGMSHHSLQDIAVTRAIPNLEVILPADRLETEAIFEYLLTSDKPAYIRLGRNAVEDCYTEKPTFEIGKAVTLREGNDVALLATGEMVRVALDAQEALKAKGIQARVINFPTIKPFDQAVVKQALLETKLLISLEEHSIYGGLGAAVSEVASNTSTSIRHLILGIPDEPAIAGTSQEIFAHYGLSAEGVTETVIQNLPTDKEDKR
ncbi:transketolase family protein [Listeria immobilis]|uniref:Transketolase family protein n=1 Tax=Listeria immobilis TaxID=2713502 RepID=A0ABR6SYP9_9LIST|nr:transketolase C-terminal domain-containing protein [Listeria immobilis]MBC1484249.1 transketolase family protein [Listeria immobilis]MBC1507808.1 transketolase family protein [Listeria immobilis]MBC1510791.1 transketolase family protein [Listeria immobilis]MBC1515031.1 transketolase family protein [Listeria immobilis]MBC6303987.1 transketolase family protein [Listeria immobilis]